MKMLHQQQMSAFRNIDFLQVYRGKLIPIEELEHFKKNIGKLHVTVRFLSTVTHREVALIYSGGGRIWETDYVSVLFNITINMKENISKPIAFIHEYSSILDENEVLLPIGMLFRMNSIRHVKEKLWEINFEGNVQQKSLNNNIQMTTDETSDFLNQPKSSRVPSEIHHQTKAITMTTTKEQQPEKQKKQWINRSMSSHREIEYCQTLVKPFEDYQKQVLIHFCSRNFLIDQIGYSRFILTSLTITQYHSIDIPNIIDRFEHLVLLNHNDMIQVRNLYGYFNKFTNQSNPDLLSNIEEESSFSVYFSYHSTKMIDCL
ncbi:unnamed protein product [Rotaria sordida]|uniref:Uncharacterized protein n=1 Tax=Rotaria sordida TaxID=392033 RepID=A0A815HQ10_9BILA|nr:unnamed protein product [Rotaria sordida]CAF3985811.1 unnamed protein product [Rotaria sordida]